MTKIQFDKLIQKYASTIEQIVIDNAENENTLDEIDLEHMNTEIYTYLNEELRVLFLHFKNLSFAK